MRAQNRGNASVSDGIPARTDKINGNFPVISLFIREFWGAWLADDWVHSHPAAGLGAISDLPELPPTFPQLADEFAREEHQYSRLMARKPAHWPASL
jgi:hypothetical protein